jgi:hypothetical protein
MDFACPTRQSKSDQAQAEPTGQVVSGALRRAAPGIDNLKSIAVAVIVEVEGAPTERMQCSLNTRIIGSFYGSRRNGWKFEAPERHRWLLGL